MTPPILMYRSIGETVPRGFQRWVVRPAQLRAQVRGLAEAGYATLASLCQQTQRPIGSSWRSTTTRSCWPTPHRLCRSGVANHEARGLSGGRNTGVTAATGDLIVFIDDDAVIDASWLDIPVARCKGPDILEASGWIDPRRA
jgi:glycosyltransferase involved in cell wall biosynthesis